MDQRPNILCGEKQRHTHARRHFDSPSLFLPAAASLSNGSQAPVIQPPYQPPYWSLPWNPITRSTNEKRAFYHGFGILM